MIMFFLTLFLILVVYTSDIPEDLYYSEAFAPEHYISFTPSDTPEDLLSLFSELHFKHYDALSYTSESIQLRVTPTELSLLSPHGTIKYDTPEKLPLPGYQTYTTMINHLHSLEQVFKGHVKVINLSERYKIQTHEHRDIYCVKLSHGYSNTKPNILVVSGHHAREILTGELAMKFVDNITEGYKKKEKTIMRVLGEYNVFVVPFLNVDGLEYVFGSDRWWRKNRRVVTKSDLFELSKFDRSGGERGVMEFYKNSTEKVFYGIDLNRNYQYQHGYEWEKMHGFQCLSDEMVEALQLPNTNVYRGHKPFSEPETQIMKLLTDEFNFAKIFDFHSYGRMVIHAGGCIEYPKNVEEMLEKYLKDITPKSYVYYTQFPNYGVVGDHNTYQYARTTAMIFLAETHIQFQPSFAETLKEIEELLPMLYEFMKIPIPISGYVKDDFGNPLAVDILVEEIPEITRKSDKLSGGFHLFLPKGEYNVIFKDPIRYQKQKIVYDGENKVVLFITVPASKATAIGFMLASVVLFLVFLCCIAYYNLLISKWKKQEYVKIEEEKENTLSSEQERIYNKLKDRKDIKFKGKKVDERIQNLIDESGIEITKEEEIEAIANISTNDKINFFEKIARETKSRDKVLFDLIADLVIKHQRVKKIIKRRKPKFDEKVDQISRYEIWIEDKLEIIRLNELEIPALSRDAKKVLSQLDSYYDLLLKQIFTMKKDKLKRTEKNEKDTFNSIEDLIGTLKKHMDRYNQTVNSVFQVENIQNNLFQTVLNKLEIE